MKRFLYIICVCYIILLSVSCNNNTVTLSERETVTISVNEFDHGTEINYSDVFSNIEYILLECTSKSAVGNIRKLLVTSQNEYVVFDYSNRKILLFNPKGKFLCQIGQCGHGANEYIHPGAIAYDKYNNRILIYDGGKKVILHYDTKGKYLTETKLQKYIDDFDVVDDGLLALFSNYMDDIQDKEIAYNLEIIDFDGQIVSQFFPYTNKDIISRGNKKKTFCWQNEHLSFHEMYSSMFYSVEKDGVLPWVHVDLGAKQIPEEYNSISSLEDFESKIMKMENIGYVTSLYSTSNKYVLDVDVVSEKRSNKAHVFVDKQDTKKQISGRFSYNDIQGFITSVFMHYNDNKIYGIIYPEEANMYCDIFNNIKYFEYFREQYKNKGYDIIDKDVKLIGDIANNNNPTIQICTVK